MMLNLPALLFTGLMATTVFAVIQLPLWVLITGYGACFVVGFIAGQLHRHHRHYEP